MASHGWLIKVQRHHKCKVTVIMAAIGLASIQNHDAGYNELVHCTSVECRNTMKVLQWMVQWPPRLVLGALHRGPLVLWEWPLYASLAGYTLFKLQQT